MVSRSAEERRSNLLCRCRSMREKLWANRKITHRTQGYFIIDIGVQPHYFQDWLALTILRGLGARNHYINCQNANLWWNRSIQFKTRNHIVILVLFLSHWFLKCRGAQKQLAAIEIDIPDRADCGIWLTIPKNIVQELWHHTFWPNKGAWIISLAYESIHRLWLLLLTRLCAIHIPTYYI